ncbi:MAG: hypothetical protein KF789_10355, partial [Bdellovibrionaceae bacterium]|nr:hypothetical protein [Pseudobdellovibrionaceae bacterium]
MTKWIFGSFPKDFLFLVFPGLATLLLVMFMPSQEGFFPEILAFFALAFCDSGHVYTTFWRTYAIAKERKSTVLYFTVPVLIFLVVGTWVFLGVPGLWTVVIWLTVFHNYRQFHGILRWEQKVNKDRDIWEGRFLMFLCAWPFLLYHLRDVNVHFYSADAMLMMPWPEALPWGLGLYFVVVTAWLLRTLRKVWAGTFRWPVVLAVLTPGLFYGVAFLLGTNLAQILFPLVVSHAVAYFGLMSLSLERLEVPFRKGFAVWLGVILVTALIFGWGESSYEEWMLGD